MKTEEAFGRFYEEFIKEDFYTTLVEGASSEDTLKLLLGHAFAAGAKYGIEATNEILKGTVKQGFGSETDHGG